MPRVCSPNAPSAWLASSCRASLLDERRRRPTACAPALRRSSAGRFSYALGLVLPLVVDTLPLDVTRMPLGLPSVLASEKACPPPTPTSLRAYTHSHASTHALARARAHTHAPNSAHGRVRARTVNTAQAAVQHDATAAAHVWAVLGAIAAARDDPKAVV